MEDLTLTKCGNNVHTYLTTIQKKRNEINANLPDGEEYLACCFHTNMFTQLEKSTCNDFLKNVKDAKSRWIKSPDTFDQATTTIQEKRNDINDNLLDGEEYPACCFHTNMFTQLEKLTCDDFLTNVKDAKSRWIKSHDTFNQATEIGDLIKIYTNYASTGTWMKSN